MFVDINTIETIPRHRNDIETKLQRTRDLVDHLFLAVNKRAGENGEIFHSLCEDE